MQGVQGTAWFARVDDRLSAYLRGIRIHCSCQMGFGFANLRRGGPDSSGDRGGVEVLTKNGRNVPMPACLLHMEYAFLVVIERRMTSLNLL